MEHNEPQSKDMNNELRNDPSEELLQNFAGYLNSKVNELKEMGGERVSFHDEKSGLNLELYSNKFNVYQLADLLTQIKLKFESEQKNKGDKNFYG